MKFIVENWFLVLISFAALVVVSYAVYVFLKRPTSEQIAKVKEWLLYAVAQAEKELGGGTGQLKLRYVYDMFVGKFPYLVKVVSFDSFSLLVDEVLKKFKSMLESNVALKQYVDGDTVSQ